MWNILLFILPMVSLYVGQQIPSPDQVNNAVTDLITKVNETRIRMTGSNKGDILKPPTGGQDMPLLAGFLRLSYHDCIGEGACDGCLNLTDPGNKGLDKVVDVLNGLYDENGGYGMSRADYYALAGWTAVQIAPKKRRTKTFLEVIRENDDINFLFGREDCDNTPYETEDDVNIPDRFPSSCFTLEQSVEFFNASFNFTQQETVAIMGAHTLGMIRHGLPRNRAREWVPGGGCSSRFNNKLYKKMMSSKLRPQQQKNKNKVCSWVGSGTFLDSDVSVAYNISRNDDGTVSCPRCDINPKLNKTVEKCCDKADGYDQVKEYKKNNAKFIEDFARAYQKMLNHGHDDLESVAYNEPARLYSKPPKAKRGKKGKKDERMSYIKEAVNNVQNDIDDIENDLE